MTAEFAPGDPGLRDTGTAVAMLPRPAGLLRGDALSRSLTAATKAASPTSAAIRELCLLAVLCAAVTSICPEGNVKKICSLTCSIVMITAALKPLAGFDFNEYAVQSFRALPRNGRRAHRKLAGA